jgi:hypothetical protein
MGIVFPRFTFVWSYLVVEYPLKLSIAALVNGRKRNQQQLVAQK